VEYKTNGGLEASGFSQTLLPNYQVTPRHVPEVPNINIHRQANCKPQKETIYHLFRAIFTFPVEFFRNGLVLDSHLHQAS
jgi:hypothetical protein